MEARERSDGWFPRRARETSEEVVFARRGSDLDASATSREALCARRFVRRFGPIFGAAKDGDVFGWISF